MIENARYVHTNLVARDWHRLAAFYCDVFGCVPVPPERHYRGRDLERGTGVEGTELHGVHLLLPGFGPGGPTLEIYSYTVRKDGPVPAVNRPGFGHVAFGVDDVERARQQVLAAGGGTVGDVVTLRTTAGDLVTWCYLTDPEGNVIELQSWSSPGGLPPGVVIRNDLRPGDIGELTRLHGLLYAREYGWDHTFEAYVAGPLSEFAVSHGERERIWIVERDGAVAGSVAVVAASEHEAQLRWYLLHPGLRGKGLGRRLLDEAVDFARRTGYRSMFLWTEARLAAAASGYAGAGFVMIESKTHSLWGTTVTEQRWVLNLT